MHEKVMHSRLFDTYLPEFMWRKEFDGPFKNAFVNIISRVCEQYPV